MEYKQFSVKYNDAGNGSIEGYASTWIERPDSYGDIVKEGAFARTLRDRWNGGQNIPLLWAHQMDNLNAYIGIAKAEEDDNGLHFYADFDGTDEAQKVRSMYKDGRLSKFSFAYDVLDSASVMLEDGTKANQLRDVELFEISCVCVPANDDAGVIGVKSKEEEQVDTKSGRRNSAKDAEDLKQAIALIQRVLGELDDIPAEEDTEAKSEEPDTVNDEELMKNELLEKAKKILMEE